MSNDHYLSEVTRKK